MRLCPKCGEEKAEDLFFRPPRKMPADYHAPCLDCHSHKDIENGVFYLYLMYYPGTKFVKMGHGASKFKIRKDYCRPGPAEIEFTRFENCPNGADLEKELFALIPDDLFGRHKHSGVKAEWMWMTVRQARKYVKAIETKYNGNRYEEDGVITQWHMTKETT